MRLRDRLPNYLELPNSEADFIIYKSGTLTKAYNTLTGEVQYSETNADVAINGAISRLTNGGRIYCRPGEYNLHAPIDFGTKVIELEGVGGGVTTHPDAYPNTYFKLHADLGADYMIKAGVDNTATDGIKIKGIVMDIDEDVACLGGIHLVNANHCVISDVWIGYVYNTATPGYAINLERTVGDSAYYPTIQNCNLHYNTVGIRLGEGANAGKIIGGQITGRAAVATTGLLIDGASTLTLLGPCDLEAHSHASGIGLNIQTSTAHCFHNLRCEGNTLDVNIAAGGSANRFFGGMFTTVTDVGTTKSRYFGVVGYVTEMMYEAIGTGAQQTIAHGMNATPRIVLLTDKDNGALANLTADADATNIYPTAVLNKKFYWYVRKY